MIPHAPSFPNWEGKVLFFQKTDYLFPCTMVEAPHNRGDFSFQALESFLVRHFMARAGSPPQDRAVSLKRTPTAFRYFFSGTAPLGIRGNGPPFVISSVAAK